MQGMVINMSTTKCGKSTDRNSENGSHGSCVHIHDIKIYSTLGRKTEAFHPISEGEIGIYACGITVYDEAHIGHARQAIVFDMIRRYLEWCGYKVTYVRNFTDVDDKIINKSKATGVPALEISSYYIESTRQDLAALKVKPASHEPKVSDHIREIIEFVVKLIEKGYAYSNGCDVLFDVSRSAEYGKLSGRRLEDCLNAEDARNKRNPQDFALWKGAKPGEPQWESPWGPGRPGWHIECSVMAKQYLGEHFDIHGGGGDLIFPHHENEIAQSEAGNGGPFANYWVHNGLVNVNGQKMSKSLGNMVNIKQVLAEHHPDVIRFAALIQRYNSPIDFSESLFRAATKRVYYFYRSLDRVDELLGENPASGSHMGNEFADRIMTSFVTAMDNDFNSAEAFAQLFQFMSRVNEELDSQNSVAQKSAFLTPVRKVIREIAEVMGIFDENPADCVTWFKQSGLRKAQLSESEIQRAIEQREAARRRKDYNTADQIRASLLSRGVVLQDISGEVTKWDLSIE